MYLSREAERELPTEKFDDKAWVFRGIAFNEVPWTGYKAEWVTFEGMQYNKHEDHQVTRYGGPKRQRVITSFEEAIIIKLSDEDKFLLPELFVISSHTYAEMRCNPRVFQCLDLDTHTICHIPYVINRYIKNADKS